jgi:steroid 5-alpha reductase family enzyme
MNIWTACGCLVSILGIVLEAAADATAHRFRKEHPGQVNDRGLWKYSRHPNYLGEITFWWGVFFMMLSVEPESWHFFVGPLANTLLFIFISIPLMEKRQLRNKPDYQTYREETSMLLLLPKKRKRPVTSSSRG